MSQLSYEQTDGNDISKTEIQELLMTDLPDMAELNLKKDVKRSYKYKLLKNYIFGEKEPPSPS